MGEIVVTGATGFIGTPLCSLLEEKGHSLIRLDSSAFDITDETGFERFRGERISHIFHLAASTFVPKSWDEPSEFIKTNVNGTQNVLEFARKKGARVTFSSAYVYGVPREWPITEEHPVRPNNPYALSKYLAEQLCRFYAENFDVDAVSLRLFNVFGKNQKEHFLIPSLVDQVENEDVIRVRDLRPKRDYVYLKDVLSAFAKTLEMKEGYRVYNVAGGRSYSVAEVIGILQDIYGTDKDVRSEEVERRNEIRDTRASYDRIREELGWMPEYDLPEGLNAMVRDE